MKYIMQHVKNRRATLAKATFSRFKRYLQQNQKGEPQLGQINFKYICSLNVYSKSRQLF